MMMLSKFNRSVRLSKGFFNRFSSISNSADDVRKSSDNKSNSRPRKLHNRMFTEKDKSLNSEHYNRFKDIEETFGEEGNGLRHVKYGVNLQTLAETVLPKNKEQVLANERTKLNFNKTSNRFGLLSKELNEEEKKDRLDQKYGEEAEELPHRRLSSFDRRNPPLWYGKRIEEFGRQGKIREAIEVLDVWMLKRDRVMPTKFCFTVLIGILARAGYTKKCFQLFNQMKKMGLQPEAPTYTALFNACSNSPWASDGLSRATKLHDLLRVQNYTPNLPTYHAIIKAYSRCGDVPAAFRTMDELLELHQPTDETYGFLLMACCSDTNAGFLHAIQVWREIKRHGVTPNIIHYNLLLRSVRDCGIGDPRIATFTLNSLKNERLDEHVNGGRRLVDKINNNRQQRFSEINSGDVDIGDLEIPLMTLDRKNQQENKRLLTEEIGSKKGSVQKHDNLLTDAVGLKEVVFGENDLVALDYETHNIVKFSEHDQFDHLEGTSYPTLVESQQTSASLDENSLNTTSIESYNALVNSNNELKISLVDVKTPANRLTLLGGLRGFMQHLKSQDIDPDIKTLTLLIDVIEKTTEEENELIEYANKSGADLDVDFFNLLIEKRTKRQDYAGAMEIVAKISDHQLFANTRTYGCLALGCKKKLDGMQLLRDIELSGMSATIEIYGILVYHSYLDFSYKQLLLQHLQSNGILPNHKLLACVESAINEARKNIVKVEHSKDTASFFSSEYFVQGYEQFMRFYPEWLKRIEYDQPVHPWESFRRVDTYH